MQKINNQGKLVEILKSFYHAVQVEILPSIILYGFSLMVFASGIGPLIMFILALGGYACIILAYYYEDKERSTNTVGVSSFTKVLKIVGRIVIVVTNIIMLIIVAATVFQGLSI